VEHVVVEEPLELLVDEEPLEPLVRVVVSVDEPLLVAVGPERCLEA
jgi:hypothetical protein